MKKISPKLILALQLVVMLYTLSSVAAKMASGQSFLSLPFLIYYGVEILILGFYAIAWQQIIKRCDLSVAYANRSVYRLQDWRQHRQQLRINNKESKIEM